MLWDAIAGDVCLWHQMFQEGLRSPGHANILVAGHGRSNGTQHHCPMSTFAKAMAKKYLYKSVLMISITENI